MLSENEPRDHSFYVHSNEKCLDLPNSFWDGDRSVGEQFLERYNQTLAEVVNAPKRNQSTASSSTRMPRGMMSRVAVFRERRRLRFRTWKEQETSDEWAVRAYSDEDSEDTKGWW